MPTFYHVRVAREELGGTLRVNDVPLAGWKTPDSTTSINAINMWITGRHNRAAVVFDRPLPVGTPTSSLEIAILATTRNQAAPEARTIASIHWPHPGQPPQRPSEVTLLFDVDEPPPSTLWGNLTPLALDPATRAAVHAALADLNAAIDAHDVARVTSHLEFKCLDVGAALYFAPEDSRSGQRDFFAFFLDRPSFRMQPYDSAAMALELVADRRLVMVSRVDGSPALQSRVGDSPRLELPVFLAPIRGRWTVVR